MIFLCFFLSGFAALLYQIVWTRLAFMHLGVIPPILSAVLAIFMLGLGAGAWGAGRWVQHRSTWKTAAWLRGYAACEALCAIWVLALPFLFFWVETQLYAAPGLASSAYLWRAGIFLVVILLPPCLLLGMTTPLMMASVGPARRSPRQFSYLYVANLVGAVVGVLATAFLLIEFFGLRQTLSIGIFAQTLAAAVALAGAMNRPSEPSTLATTSTERRGLLDSLTSRLALSTLFVTGFVTLTSEVLWTRSLTTLLGTSIYAFALILAVYLMATLAGAMIYRHRTQDQPPGILLYGVFVACVWLPALIQDPALAQFPWLLLGSAVPLCAVAGYLTPFWVDRYSQGDPPRAARAYAINTLGCVIGPLVAGYVLLPTLGSRTGMIVIAGVAACVGIWMFSVSTSVLSRTGFLLMNVVVALICVGRPALDESVLGASGPRVVRRDYAATVVSAGEGFSKRLLINGVGTTVLTPLTKVMAHLPMVYLDHPPQRVLMICFGMGTSYRSLLSWDVDTTAVELVPSVPKAFGFYHIDAAAVMSHPKGRVVIDDGRRFLARTIERYDVITLDPPPPVEAAGSSLLYSEEFYALVRSRLAPGGILQQWWPQGEKRILHAVALSIYKEFPYVRVYKGLDGMGFHFLASETPIPHRTIGEIIRRMPDAARRDLLEWTDASWTLPLAWRSILREPISIERLVGPATQSITDDRPYNEYYVWRRWMAEREGSNFWVR